MSRWCSTFAALSLWLPSRPATKCGAAPITALFCSSTAIAWATARPRGDLYRTSVSLMTYMAACPGEQINAALYDWG